MTTIHRNRGEPIRPADVILISMIRFIISHVERPDRIASRIARRANGLAQRIWNMMGSIVCGLVRSIRSPPSYGRGKQIKYRRMYCECPLSSVSYELVGAAKIDTLDPDDAVILRLITSTPPPPRLYGSVNPRLIQTKAQVNMAFHPQLDEVRELQHP